MKSPRRSMKRPRAADVADASASSSGSNGKGKGDAHNEERKTTESAQRSCVASPQPTRHVHDVPSWAPCCSSGHSSVSSSSSSSSFLSSRSTSMSSARRAKREDEQKHYPIFTSAYAARFTWDHVPFLRANSDDAPCVRVSPLLRQPPHSRSPPGGFVLYNEYRLLRELGKGTYAKVVLCRSLRTGETCALKIFRGERHYADACIDEVSVLDALCRPPGHLSSGVRLFADASSAECEGRAGRFIVPMAHLSHPAHHAIVLPAMGPSLLDVLRGIPRGALRTEISAREASFRQRGALHVDYAGLPMDLLRAVLFQILLFLRHAHARGIVHTDLKPENVLFETAEAVPVQLRIATRRFDRPQQQQQQHGGDMWARGDGSLAAQSPHMACGAVVHETSVTAQLPVVNGVRVIDLGAAEFLTQCKHVSPLDSTTPVLFERIQTTHYRSPEVLLEVGWNTAADMWSLGCMIPELLTGDCVFMPKENIEHLALIQHIVGPFGESDEMGNDGSIVPRVFSRGRCFSKYFDPHTLQLLWPPPHVEGTAAESVEGNPKRRRRDITAEDVQYVSSQPTLSEILAPHPTLLNLCRRMLDYDPLRRITAEDALRHPFFTSPRWDDPHA